MGDLDLDAIEALPLPDEQGWRRQELLALVAEVRRLRAIEDAAQAVLKNQRLEVGQRACEFTIPCPQYCTDRDGWCHWCDLVAALEGHS